MFDLQPLLGIAALNLAATMSPGPAFVLVTQTAVSSRRDVALAAAAGTVTASMTWCLGALLGWQFLLVRAVALYRFLHIAGGCYLGYIGVMMWLHARDPLPELDRQSLTRGAAWRKALFLGLSNPKVIVFFGTVFTALFTPQTPAAIRWASPLIVLFNECVWYSLVATLFGTAPVQRIYRRLKAGAERVFGSFLLLFSARLVFRGIVRSGV